MAKSPESAFTNAKIGEAFYWASTLEGIRLPDGNDLRITPKSGKSTWSKKPNSFETDDQPKKNGPHAGNWVLWTPSKDLLEPTWNLLPDDRESSALLKVMAGSLQIFARGANSAYRDTTAISRSFADQKASSSERLAFASQGETVDVEEQARLVVRAAVPEGKLSEGQLATLEQQGAVFLEKVVHLGDKACTTLLAEED